jgi:hypothetical protein
LQALAFDAAEHHRAETAIADRQRFGPVRERGWRGVPEAQGLSMRMKNHNAAEDSNESELSFHERVRACSKSGGFSAAFMMWRMKTSWS